MWALATALKWFPALLIVVLPPRARLWGIAWLVLMGILTLAIWPVAERQLGIVIDYPRPLRIDYLLLAWAAVPWLWSHPRWLEVSTWREQVSVAWRVSRSAVSHWWSGSDRLAVAWQMLVLGTRRSLGLA